MKRASNILIENKHTYPHIKYKNIIKKKIKKNLGTKSKFAWIFVKIKSLNNHFLFKFPTTILVKLDRSLHVELTMLPVWFSNIPTRFIVISNCLNSSDINTHICVIRFLFFLYHLHIASFFSNLCSFWVLCVIFFYPYLYR